jgi:hypothetical protein
MAPNHPPGENKGSQPKAEGSASAHQDGSAPNDTALMEEVVRELSEQNEHARTDGAFEAEPARKPGQETPIPRTVRLDGDSGFRTPAGAPAARAYLPARTLEPGQSEPPEMPLEMPSVKVEDPRRLPTLRLPRMRKELVQEEGKGRTARAGRSLMPDDTGTGPTLRSAVGISSRPKPAKLSGWVLAIVVLSIVALVIVALAVRYLPASSVPGAASSTPSAGPNP